jgi:hypothetical protein
MENTENKNEKVVLKNDAPKKNNNVLMIILIAVLAGATGYYAYTNSKLNEELTGYQGMYAASEEEKDELIIELEEMASAYDTMAVSNDSLSAELMVEKAKVEELLKEAKNNRYAIYKLKKEASTLREIMKGYVVTIDSLNTLNVELRAENAEVSRRLDEQKSRNDELSDENRSLAGKVKLGARLNALDLISYGQRVKKSGVHKETNRSDKVMKIKTCLTLSANEVTETGKKWVYVKIFSPDGTVLLGVDGDDTFETHTGGTSMYSAKKEVFYEREELDLCTYWDKSSELQAGDYIIEVYVDGFNIGTTTFRLK